MKLLYWPEPVHDIRCCVRDPWTDPKPGCPGWAELKGQAAA